MGICQGFTEIGAGFHACFNQIPPQRKLDIIQGKKIIVCEYCGRILVNPEYKNDYKTEEA